jgi:hypothetical protein
VRVERAARSVPLLLRIVAGVVLMLAT